MENRGSLVYIPGVRRRLAETLLQRDRPGDRDRAEALLDAAEAVARDLGELPERAMLLGVRARLAALRGDREGTERALNEALAMAREMDARGLLQELQREAAAGAAVDA